jgi:hypothetical protein
LRRQPSEKKKQGRRQLAARPARIGHQAATSHSRGEPRSSTLRPLREMTGRSPVNFGKSKRHEILDDGSIQRATVRYGHTNRL